MRILRIAGSWTSTLNMSRSRSRSISSRRSSSRNRKESRSRSLLAEGDIAGIGADQEQEPIFSLII